MPQTYQVYGVALQSHWPLPCLEATGRSVASVELRKGSAGQFATATRALDLASATGSLNRRLNDGSMYLRWDRHFEFLIDAGGHRIAGRSLRAVAAETFDSYLLGPALSFALLKQGVEPLHSTTVVVGDKAIGFLGDCGYGKSSLAAWFVRMGHRLLTDDLLVVAPHGGQLMAHPGPPRIKLFRNVAERILNVREGAALDSPFVSKLVVTLNAEQSCGRATPLTHLYVLGAPRRVGPNRVHVSRLSPRRAFVELIRNTFNTTVTDSERLAQQLSWCARLASAVRVKRVSYSRRWATLPAVYEAVLTDLDRPS